MHGATIKINVHCLLIDKLTGRGRLDELT